MYQLKQMLNDLVDTAYKDDQQIIAYKAFYIEVVEKNYKSKHGDYNRETRHIRLMNPYRDENKLIITSIHELAHHINNMQGNTDSHGPGFYSNYEKLLHAALDMGLFDKNEYLNILRESRDAIDEKKVQKMIQLYRPKDIGYKKDVVKIIIYGAFDIKETLKEKGFVYNKISKAWEIELIEDKANDLKLFLEKNGIKYETASGSRYIVKSEDSKRHIIAVINAYDIKESLKEMGYKYRAKDSAWYIPYDGGRYEAENLIKKIKSITKNTDLKVTAIESYGSEIKVTLKQERR